MKEKAMSDEYIKREDAINAVADQMAFEASMETGNDYMGADYSDDAKEWLSGCPSADRPQEWIPCEKQLPRVGIRVLLCLTNGQVLIGHRDRPDLVWQVTEKDGRRHWVYDPEAYTDDIDSLPKAEDCGFSQDSDFADGFLSVTSVNYNKMFSGVVAWMPLPKPWKGSDDE